MCEENWVPRFLTSEFIKFRSFGGHLVGVAWMCAKKVGAKIPEGVQNRPWEVQDRPWGCPAEVPRNRLQKNRFTAGQFQANGSTMGPPNRPSGGIFDDFFKYFPASFLGYLFIIFMIYLGVFGYLFETS